MCHHVHQKEKEVKSIKHAPKEMTILAFSKYQLKKGGLFSVLNLPSLVGDKIKPSDSGSPPPKLLTTLTQVDICFEKQDPFAISCQQLTLECC